MAAVDWFASAAAAPAPVRAPRGRAVRAPAAAPARRTRAAGRRLTGGIAWISVVAVLLAGVVAVNVAVLRANVAVHRLDEQRAQLQARNEALASELSAASSAPKIEAAAHRLGLVQAPASATTYLDLAPRRR